MFFSSRLFAFAFSIAFSFPIFLAKAADPTETLPYSGTFLSLPPSISPRFVVAVNDNGDVAFNGAVSGSETETLIRYRDGSVTNLWENIPSYDTGPFADVYDLNNKGQALIVYRTTANSHEFFDRVALHDHGRVTLFPPPGEPSFRIRQAFLSDSGRIVVNVSLETGVNNQRKAKFWNGRRWEAYPAMPGLPHQWVVAVAADGTAYGISMGTAEVYDHLGVESRLQSTAVCLFRPGQTIPISPLRGPVQAVNERGDFVMSVGTTAVFQPRGKPSVNLGPTHIGLLNKGDIGYSSLSFNGTLSYASVIDGNRADYHVRLPDGTETIAPRIQYDNPPVEHESPRFDYRVTDAGVVNLLSTNAAQSFHFFFGGSFHSLVEASPADPDWRRYSEAMDSSHTSVQWSLSRSGVAAFVLFEGVTDDLQAINPRLALLKPGRASVRALEITQVVQDWSNSIPLIAGKQTFARGHIEATKKDAIGRKARGTLRAFKDGVELAGSPLAPVNKKGFGIIARDSALLRDKPGNALDFILPIDWCTNTVVFSLESAEGDFLSRSETIAFTNIQPMLAKVFPLTLVSLGVPTETSDADALVLLESALGLLPMSKIETGPFRRELQMDADEITNINDLDRVNSRLRAILLRDADSRGINAGNARDAAKQLGFYLGITDLFELGGMVDEVGRVGSVATLAGVTKAPNRGAHEIGHLLGQHHTVLSTLPAPDAESKSGYCDEVARSDAPDFPFFGKPPGQTHDVPLLGPINKTPEEQIYGATLVDGKLTVFSPLKHFELMGYCDQPRRWISGYTYTNILQEYLVFRGPAPAPDANRLFMAAAPVPRMIVRGQINLLSGAATLDPALPLSPGPVPNAPQPGDYTLEFRSATGAVLTAVPFGVSRPVETETRRSFMFVVSPPPGTARLAVTRNNQTLAFAGSANSPAVQIISPNSGVISGASLNLIWQAADADSDPLRYAVDYSADAGTTWTTLALDHAKTNLTIHLSSLTPSSVGAFRVTASDGLNFATDISDGPIVIPAQPPVIAIVSPVAAERFEPGDSIFFHAASSSSLTGVTWQSDRDGLLGNGLKLQRASDSLSPGVHQITVSGRDSAGQIGSAVISINVAPFETPRVISAQVDNLSSPATLILSLLSSAGINLVLEASSNLVAWTSVTNTFTSTEEASFEIPLDTGHRFFRVAGALAPPEITAEPEDISSQVGIPSQISVGVTGAEPLAFYWHRNGALLPGAPNQPALVFANPSATNSGNYSVIVSNRLGFTTSRIASINFTNQAPTIFSGPGSDQCFREGFFVSFGVNAEGIPEPTYQWFHNNQPITGATARSYFIDTPTTAHLGDYFVRVTNEAGSVDSSIVKLKTCP